MLFPHGRLVTECVFSSRDDLFIGKIPAVWWKVNFVFLFSFILAFFSLSSPFLSLRIYCGHSAIPSIQQTTSTIVLLLDVFHQFTLLIAEINIAIREPNRERELQSNNNNKSHKCNYQIMRFQIQATEISKY